MLTAFTSLLPIFSLIALGFVLRKSGIVPSEQWRGIELVTFWLLFPALLITTLATADFSFGELSAFALALFVMVVAMSLVVWLMRRPLKRALNVNGPAFTTIFQTSTRWHGFIALAIVDKLFGATGVAILAIAFVAMVPWLNVINILVLTAYAGTGRTTGRVIAGALLRNPLIWGITIGIIVKLIGFEMPDPLFTTLDLLGRGALGISLLAMGAGLSWKAMRHSGREVVLASFLRLLVTPVLALGLSFVFNVTGMQLVIMLIAASVPTAVNGYVLARTMGGDAELYAATSTAQVIASFVTLPLIIWLAMAYTL